MSPDGQSESPFDYFTDESVELVSFRSEPVVHGNRVREVAQYEGIDQPEEIVLLHAPVSVCNSSNELESVFRLCNDFAESRSIPAIEFDKHAQDPNDVYPGYQPPRHRCEE